MATFYKKTMQEPKKKYWPYINVLPPLNVYIGIKDGLTVQQIQEIFKANL